MGTLSTLIREALPKLLKENLENKKMTIDYSIKGFAYFYEIFVNNFTVTHLDGPSTLNFLFNEENDNV